SQGATSDTGFAAGVRASPTQSRPRTPATSATTPASTPDVSALSAQSQPMDVAASSPFVPSDDAATEPTPGANSDPQATVTPDATSGDATFIASNGDPTYNEALMDNTAGGRITDPPHVISTIPAPPADAQPSIDPLTIASPEPVDGQQPHAIIDLDAAAPGIQSTRTVHVGDIVRIGVVLVGVPAYDANAKTGGLAAFNFVVNYDLTKILAPTIAGGSTIARNPRPNVAALGGSDAKWSCLPAPEGDTDEPGGIDGDGDPATGQAFLSCFTPAT